MADVAKHRGRYFDPFVMRTSKTVFYKSSVRQGKGGIYFAGYFTRAFAIKPKHEIVRFYPGTGKCCRAHEADYETTKEKAIALCEAFAAGKRRSTTASDPDPNDPFFFNRL